MLEVEGEKAGKAFGRQARLLEDHRLTAAEADAFEVRHRRVLCNPQQRSDGLARGLDPGGDDPGGRVEPTSSHLLGEAHRAGDVPVDAGLEDVGPAPTNAFDPALADELAKGVAHGDEAAAVALGQLALRRHSVAGSPLA